MRHARYYFIFVLVSFCAFAQNRPGVDYFPQIGFFDFMVQYLHPPHGNSASIETSVISNNYYHPKLKELGITDIVRFTMPDSGDIQLKIHDMLGQQIFNKTLYKEKGSHTEIINFKDITASTGIYILSLDIETGGKHQNKNAKIQYMK